MMPMQHSVKICLTVRHSVLQVDCLKVENNETATLNINIHTILCPRVIRLCLHREPQPEKPRRPNTTHQIQQLKTPTPKTQCKTPTPKLP